MWLRVRAAANELRCRRSRRAVSPPSLTSPDLCLYTSTRINKVSLLLNNSRRPALSPRTHPITSLLARSRQVRRPLAPLPMDRSPRGTRIRRSKAPREKSRPPIGKTSLPPSAFCCLSPTTHSLYPDVSYERHPLRLATLAPLAPRPSCPGTLLAPSDPQPTNQARVRSSFNSLTPVSTPPPLSPTAHFECLRSIGQQPRSLRLRSSPSHPRLRHPRATWWPDSTSTTQATRLSNMFVSGPAHCPPPPCSFRMGLVRG